MSDFLPYGRQEISEADVEAVAEALRSELITQGPAVDALRGGVRGVTWAPHTRSRSRAAPPRCTARRSRRGSGEGDEVLVTPMTFAASANCALYVGARPRFVDIDPDTWNLDAAAAAEAAGEETRAVVAVCFAGLPVDLAPLDGRAP